MLPFEFNKFVYYYVFYNSLYLIFVIFLVYQSNLFILYFFNLGVSRYYFYLFSNINRKILFFNRLIVNNIIFFFFRESFQHSYKLIDKNIFEVMGPFGIIHNIKLMTKKFFLFQTGLLYHYLGFILLFLLYFILFFI